MLMKAGVDQRSEELTELSPGKTEKCTGSTQTALCLYGCFATFWYCLQQNWQNYQGNTGEKTGTKGQDVNTHGLLYMIL